MDLLKCIKKYTADLPPIRLMTLEENYIYRNLVEEKNDTEEEAIDLDSDEIDNMDEDEKEKRLFRPFHDHDIWIWII